VSGFAVGYGAPDRKNLDIMMDKIRYRGPDFSGIFEDSKCVMAQNYLAADGADNTGDQIPFGSASKSAVRICYDGQIGNLPELAQANGISNRPFLDERLLLHLYAQHNQNMLSHLSDAIFSFVIWDEQNLFAARDLLGIKTLFYGRKNGTLYLTSELKSLAAITDDVNEFPAGHYMDSQGNFTKFAELPSERPPTIHSDVDQAVKDIRDIIHRSFSNRIDFSHRTASLLSGGIDSSVIASIAAREYRKRFGEDARLMTFALGVGESQDIHNARLVAKHLQTDHHELIVSLDDILEVLPDVIYFLENFDPSLVRSSASNFLITRYASQKGIKVLLSGEGGDEVFCGYIYLKKYPLEEQHKHQMECIGFLHSNASLRLDRMNQCNSVKVVAPLISGELLSYSMGMPPEFKQKPDNGDRMEKWIFRKAFENDLPKEVVWRGKQEFSQGSGSADVLPGHFEKVISDDELKEAQAKFPIIRSKEELYYFRIFTNNFGSGKAVKTVGQWVSL
jgi:asparagine synthase (glutamine-hydrolysing)